jgi:hypothetical protein
MFELAEQLHMSVAELCHGRGTPMPLSELAVGWPAYYAHKQRVVEREQQK